MKKRHRQGAYVLAASLVGVLPAWGQQVIQVQQPPAAEKRAPLSLTLSPAAEPVPALKYRFLPSEGDLNPGDAAPIYLRLRHEQSDESIREIDSKASGASDQEEGWLQVPLKDLPVAEARKLVDRWKAQLRQIGFGARRQTCEWNYSVPEQKLEVIEILLPDAQSMRTWGRLLALKARVEIAEGKFEQAIETIETGLAFSRHVADAPFLINRLIGIAIANSLCDRVEELVSQPGAPSLYWALSVLPRPFIDLRSSLEMEQKLVEFMVPELTQVQGERSEAEWSVLLSRLLTRLGALNAKVVEWSGAQQKDPQLLKGFLEKWKEMTTSAHLLPIARTELVARFGQSQDQVDRMSDAEAIVRYIDASYREVRDTTFKSAYLPFRDTAGSHFQEQTDAVIARVKGGPLNVFAEVSPSIRSARRAMARLDRRIAALRAIEAIRLHAAASKGALPRTLADIQIVPAPVDPATGEPFSYSVSDNSATLSTDLIDGTAKSDVRYDIQIRP